MFEVEKLTTSPMGPVAAVTRLLARCEVRDDVRNTPCAEPLVAIIGYVRGHQPCTGLPRRARSVLSPPRNVARPAMARLLQLPRHLPRPRPNVSRPFWAPLVRMTIDFPRQRAQAERFPDGPSCRGHKRDGGEAGVKQYREGPYDISGCEIRAERNRPRTVRADAIPIATLKRGLMIRRNRLK